MRIHRWLPAFLALGTCAFTADAPMAFAAARMESPALAQARPVRIVVRIELDGAPVSGVRVEFVRSPGVLVESGATDAAGSVTASLAREAPYIEVIPRSEAFEFDPVSEIVSLDKDAVVRFSARLLSRTPTVAPRPMLPVAILTGRVLRNKTPVPGVDISWRELPSGRQGTVRSREDGAFRVELAAGVSEIELRASAAGFSFDPETIVAGRGRQIVFYARSTTPAPPRPLRDPRGLDTPPTAPPTAELPATEVDVDRFLGLTTAACPESFLQPYLSFPETVNGELGQEIVVRPRVCGDLELAPPEGAPRSFAQPRLDHSLTATDMVCLLVARHSSTDGPGPRPAPPTTAKTRAPDGTLTSAVAELAAKEQRYQDIEHQLAQMGRASDRVGPQGPLERTTDARTTDTMGTAAKGYTGLEEPLGSPREPRPATGFRAVPFEDLEGDQQPPAVGIDPAECAANAAFYSDLARDPIVMALLQGIDQSLQADGTFVDFRGRLLGAHPLRDANPGEVRYVLQGDLPPGLTFDRLTGEIRGTAAAWDEADTIERLANGAEISVAPTPVYILSMSYWGVDDRGFAIPRSLERHFRMRIVDRQPLIIDRGYDNDYWEAFQPRTSVPTVRGGGGPLRFSFAGDDLPHAWMDQGFPDTGAISGTPDADTPDLDRAIVVRDSSATGRYAVMYFHPILPSPPLGDYYDDAQQPLLLELPQGFSFLNEELLPHAIPIALQAALGIDPFDYVYPGLGDDGIRKEFNWSRWADAGSDYLEEEIEGFVDDSQYNASWTANPLTLGHGWMFGEIARGVLEALDWLGVCESPTLIVKYGRAEVSVGVDRDTFRIEPLPEQALLLGERGRARRLRNLRVVMNLNVSVFIPDLRVQLKDCLGDHELGLAIYVRDLAATFTEVFALDEYHPGDPERPLVDDHPLAPRRFVAWGKPTVELATHGYGGQDAGINILKQRENTSWFINFGLDMFPSAFGIARNYAETMLAGEQGNLAEEIQKIMARNLQEVLDFGQSVQTAGVDYEVDVALRNIVMRGWAGDAVSTEWKAVVIREGTAPGKADVSPADGVADCVAHLGPWRRPSGTFEPHTLTGDISVSLPHWLLAEAFAEVERSGFLCLDMTSGSSPGWMATVAPDSYPRLRPTPNYAALEVLVPMRVDLSLVGPAGAVLPLPGLPLRITTQASITLPHWSSFSIDPLSNVPLLHADRARIAIAPLAGYERIEDLAPPGSVPTDEQLRALLLQQIQQAIADMSPMAAGPAVTSLGPVADLTGIDVQILPTQTRLSIPFRCGGPDGCNNQVERITDCEHLSAAFRYHAGLDMCAQESPAKCVAGQLVPRPGEDRCSDNSRPGCSAHLEYEERDGPDACLFVRPPRVRYRPAR